jgi:hypothetical protein
VLRQALWYVSVLNPIIVVLKGVSLILFTTKLLLAPGKPQSGPILGGGNIRWDLVNTICGMGRGHVLAKTQTGKF